MYWRSLKENVKDKLIRASIKIKDLNDLICISIEIDDNLYKRAIERRYDVALCSKLGYILYYSNNNFKGKKFNYNNNY